MTGIIGGVIGFLIIALLIISFVLYILVRRAVEKSHSEKYPPPALRKHSPSQSRSSVAASDSPEVPIPLRLDTRAYCRRKWINWNRRFGEWWRDRSRRWEW